jgi:hypothetical protein
VQILDYAEVIPALCYILLPAPLGWLHAKIAKGNALDFLFKYYLFIGIGIQGVATGCLQIFRPDIVTQYVKWRESPYLLELGMANVSFGLLGLAGVWLSRGWKLAAAHGYSLFLFLTGIGHLIEIFKIGTTPGNAGAFLFSDLLVPICLWAILLLKRYRKTSPLIQLKD